ARPAAEAGVGEFYSEPEAEAPAVLFLYGAGHVGRAVVKAFEDLPFQVFWADMAAERFPDRIPANAQRLVARDLGRAAAHAPAGAWHAVMTYDHAVDLDICRRVLARGDFAYLGLIASRTKRARFLARLRASGLPDATVARLHAPLGLAGLQAKSPAIIAASLAADLLQRRAAAMDVGVDAGLSA
ncbi:MAG: XdhC family protein, partial [Alphaproteobacteria bacterium]